MKKMQLLIGSIALIFSLSLVSCLNEDNKIPPNCYDGILNNGEEAIDCGGEYCDACDPCENGIWNPELGETWVDCGGDCGPCPTSANGCQDGDEEGVDCGGSTGIDCLTLCNDGLPNGYEDNAAVDCLTPPGFPPDCGGPCEPCPSCVDTLMNQSEIGIDCGGSGCPECATDGNCLNGFVDGDEIYIDCALTEDTPGFCPQCDVYITATVDGQNLEFNGGLFGSVAPGFVSAQGTDLFGNNINVVIVEPDGGWPTFYAGGLPAITTNLANPGGGTISYTDITTSDIFASSSSVAGGSINISYIDTDVPGFLAATFSGTVVDITSGAYKTITNGKIRIFLN